MPVACHFNDLSSSLSADIEPWHQALDQVFCFANKTEENDMVDKTIPYLFYRYVYNVCIYILYMHTCVYIHMYIHVCIFIKDNASCIIKLYYPYSNVASVRNIPCYKYTYKILSQF